MALGKIAKPTFPLPILSVGIFLTLDTSVTTSLILFRQYRRVSHNLRQSAAGSSTKVKRFESTFWKMETSYVRTIRCGTLFYNARKTS